MSNAQLGTPETPAWSTFAKKLQEHRFRLTRLPLEVLQVNIGKLCNQTCYHCHVEAGPNKKRENMDAATAERVIELGLAGQAVKVVDITGGAPELNPNFRKMVTAFRDAGKEVIDRCNLTVLFEAGQEDTAQFLASQQVRIVASLPCYSRENVEAQRGDGVFEKSIKALQSLNSLGYGRDGSNLHLDLVYNPVGAHLPPPQQKLRDDYKKFLGEDFGIKFNDLYTITNMPIKRYLFDLRKSGNYDNYMQLLADNFNLGAAENVMCRTYISVGWDGQLYDCDFNQMLDMPLGVGKASVFEIESLDQFHKGTIAIGNHCYGCTAGAGSSCGGSLTSN